MQLIKHVNSIYKTRLAYEWTEDYVIKYLWSAAGYALIAVPILFTRVKRSLGVEGSVDIARAKAVVDDAIAGRTESMVFCSLVPHDASLTVLVPCSLHLQPTSPSFPC